MQGIPLSAQDRAILALEGLTLAGHTCKVIVFDEPAPALDALTQRVAAGIAATPALTRRLGGTPEQPAWVEDRGFDPLAHVRDDPSPPLDRAGLRARVAWLFTQRLDRTLPLWRIDRLALAGGRGALVWRIHHALCDGVGAMRCASALLWDTSGSPPASPAGGHAAAHAREQERRHAHLASFFAREFARSRSPFEGTIGTRREIAFAALPLARLRDAAEAIDRATLNDALLSVVGGGMRRWIEQRHGRLSSVRVKVPVSLHHPGDHAGNRDSFFTVAVPLTLADPAERLRAVHAATSVRKAEHDAETMDALLGELRRISPSLRALCERVERGPRAFALNVSNVPGPREPVSVLGAPVSSLHSIAEIAEHHAVRIAAVSLADQLCLGFCADPVLVADVQLLAEACELEAGALIAGAPSEPRYSAR